MFVFWFCPQQSYQAVEIRAESAFCPNLPMIVKLILSSTHAIRHLVRNADCHFLGKTPNPWKIYIFSTKVSYQKGSRSGWMKCQAKYMIWVIWLTWACCIPTYSTSHFSSASIGALATATFIKCFAPGKVSGAHGLTWWPATFNVWLYRLPDIISGICYVFFSHTIWKLIYSRYHILSCHCKTHHIELFRQRGFSNRVPVVVEYGTMVAAFQYWW